MFFFTCIWQYPACLPIQGRRGRRRERAPGRLPLFALPLPDHVPPENSFAITLNTSEDQEMIVYCVCFVLDCTAVSIFVDILVELTNTVLQIQYYKYSVCQFNQNINKY